MRRSLTAPILLVAAGLFLVPFFGHAQTNPAVSISPSTFAVITPHGGEEWQVGETYVIAWTTGGVPASLAKAHPRIEFVDTVRGITLTGFNSSSTFLAPDGSHSGRTTWTVTNNALVGQQFRVRVSVGGTSSTPAYQAMSYGFLKIISSFVPPSCPATTTVREGPLGNDSYAKLGLDAWQHTDIMKYRIKWLSGIWSDWFVPGLDDVDWRTNADGTLRRVWAYFGSLTHEYQSCQAKALSQDEIQKISANNELLELQATLQQLLQKLK